MSRKKSKVSLLRALPALALIMMLAGCFGPRGGTVEEKQAYVIDVQNETLEELYARKPEVKERVESAAGYGVFSNLGAKIIIISAGNGFGIVVNNSTGEKTYMRMGELGAGLGLGVKDFRAVFVFHDEDSLNKFVTSGWQWGAEADAAAKSGDKGGAAMVAQKLDRGVDIYQFTEAGITASATVSGTKYWRDNELNDKQDTPASGE
jgi:lipid-binding SYLF domain-containing protein